MITGSLERASVIALVCIAYIPSVAKAYEVATHSDISATAYDDSVLSLPDVFKALGIQATEVFDRARADARPPALNDGSARGWIRQGAVFEDEESAPRPRHHFYDPLNRRGLQWGAVTGEKSPDWALENTKEYNGGAFSPQQDYSLKDARSCLYKALTSTNETDRNKHFGLTFQTLGHVIHHSALPSRPSVMSSTISRTWRSRSMCAMMRTRPFPVMHCTKNIRIA